MSERKYRVNICPECKVKEGISSRKRLYQCGYCERWFCKKHLEPRLVSVNPIFLDVTIKDGKWWQMLEQQRKSNARHPDFQYTKIKFEELKVEKEVAWARMEAFLDGRAYGKPISKKTTETPQLPPAPISTKRKVAIWVGITAIVVFTLFLLVLIAKYTK